MNEPRILVLFHSTGGATWKMAQAVAAGAAETGAAVTLKQVPEIAEAPTIQGPDYGGQTRALRRCAGRRTGRPAWIATDSRSAPRCISAR